MKSFRFFLNEGAARGVIPKVIHFKYGYKKKHPVKENTNTPTPYEKWVDKDSNTHLGDGPHYVSDKLSESNNFTPEEDTAIKAYTGHHDPYPPNSVGRDKSYWHSHQINNALINNKPIPKHLKATEAGLSSAIKNNPIQHDVRVYSGVSFNPMDHVDENGRMKSPAYISATHSKHVADEFTDPMENDSKSSHIMEIHLHAGDPATHVEHNTLNEDEHETIIHKGVTLRYIKTESFAHPTIWNSKHVVHVHHFAIER